MPSSITYAHGAKYSLEIIMTPVYKFLAGKRCLGIWKFASKSEDGITDTETFADLKRSSVVLRIPLRWAKSHRYYHGRSSESSGKQRQTDFIKFNCTKSVL